MQLESARLFVERGREVGERRGGPEGGEAVDLVPEGFIPIHKLTLGDLPELIRTEEIFQRILDCSKRVVRINNNGLSDRRPNDDEFKLRRQVAISATGFLWYSNGSFVHVITTRHVLFDEEELQRSTFDIFFDRNHGFSRDKNFMQRCCRGDGKFFAGKSTKYDMVRAVYQVKDSVVFNFKEHGPKNEGVTSQWIPTRDHGNTSMAPIVCLISHPLGQPKHVSFGEVLDYNVHTRALYHNAPSRPGSSGGPLIVFSRHETCDVHICHLYHIGTDMKTGYKFARFDYHDSSCMGLDESVFANLSERNSEIREVFNLEDLTDRASTSLEVACLATAVPVFGAFLLQGKNTTLAKLSRSHLQPCQHFLDSTSVIPLRLSLKEVMCQISKIAPRISSFSSGDLDDGSDLVSLLDPQEPCFCQSIVKMMERGTNLGDGTVTEYFLSPSTAAEKMSSDSNVTWPWLRGSCSDVSSDDNEEGKCLMKMCLAICEQSEGIIIPAILLLMIVKANAFVKNMSLHATNDPLSSTPVEDKGHMQPMHSQTAQILPCEQTLRERAGYVQASPPGYTEDTIHYFSSGSDDDQLRLAQDVLVLLERVFELTSVSQLSGFFLSHRRGTPQQEGEENFDRLLSRCLAVSDHVQQHEMQLHPDIEYSGQEDDNRARCLCGKPTHWELSSSLHTLLVCVKNSVVDKGHDEHSEIVPIPEILTNSWHKMEGLAVDYFLLLIRGLYCIALRSSDFSPGQVILAHLGDEGCFPHGRHSLMFYLASREAFLYNSCLLAKNISKLLRPLYLAFPVSVYGRPGNWPGNVTPPEVQRTAWRLVQDAIMASGFPPAVLSALEEDAERREQLIDLYVDMKLLKWERRIHPHLFRSAVASFQKSYRIHFMTQEVPFHDATAYFVWCVGFLVCPKIIGF